MIEIIIFLQRITLFVVYKGERPLLQNKEENDGRQRDCKAILGSQ